MAAMPRTLRSKYLRAELWLRAGGRCAICGKELGDDWHADHIEPFSVTGRTNLYGMQALCRACNLAKGSKTGVKWRKHQHEAVRIAHAIREGTWTGKQIVVDAVPGAGKSTIPVLLASLLIPSKFDKIAWVVPRVPLLRQAAENFQDLDLRAALGHRHEIITSDNQGDPSRGLTGFVTTYQALASAYMPLFYHDFERFRYIVVLDEIHHAFLGGSWYGPAAALAERAGLVLLLTGTGSRHDGKPIGLWPYLRDEARGGLITNTASNEHLRFIQYSRADALREQAIIPVLFDQGDGKAYWREPDGTNREVASFEDAGDETRAALNTFLDTDAAPELVSRCVAHWRNYRREQPAAKLLVVANNIANAKKHLKTLERLGIGSEYAAIATTEDSPAAANAIKRFKKPNGSPSALEALVTVAMAYEGLDVKAITHIACLTHIRSTEWIDQMLGRGTRYSPDLGEWKFQRCWVWAPADKLMDEAISRIRAEQDPVVREIEERDAAEEAEAAESERAARHERQPIVPMAFDTRRWKAVDLDGAGMGYEETAYYEGLKEEVGLHPTTSVFDVQRLIDLHQRGRPVSTAVAERPEPTPDERIARLREAINRRCTDLDRGHGWEFGTMNREIFSQFNKSRAVMTEAELGEVWAWLNRQYPLR